MKFDELYKKVIDSCREFEERQVPIRLDFKIEDLRDALVESGMENRRLKRALWLERAEMARTSAWVFWSRKDDYNYNKWKKVERKCRSKAEEYK